MNRTVDLLFCFIGVFVVYRPISAQGLQAAIEVGIGSSYFRYSELRPPYLYQESRSVSHELSYSVGLLHEVVRSKTGGTLVTGLRFSHLRSSVRFDIGTYGPTDGIIQHTGTSSISQDYISIPLRLKSPDVLGFFVFLGPEFGFLVSARNIEHSTYAPGGPTSIDESIFVRMDNINVVLNGGIGYDFAFDSHDLYLFVSYGHGLQGTARESYWGTDWRTTDVGLTIGFRL